MADQLTQGKVEANGLEIAYLEAGSPDGPLALCLHGFPDSAWTWNQLMPELASAGYHAVAPWLRGYAPTAIPADGRYQTGALVRDAISLHQVLGGRDDAVIIGHDYGAFATYGAAALAPDRFRRVVVEAIPPAEALISSFFTFAQLKRSWYIFFFQNAAAEGVVEMDDLALIDGLWADWSPGLDSSFYREKVKEALRPPGRLAAAITYYRAILDPALQVAELADEQAATVAPTPQPTLYLHGRDCGCLGAEFVDDGVLKSMGPGSEYDVIEEAGHFVHLDRPEYVNNRIVEFLSR
jgi:pimeloyl-ACP methyl ester carboxylesterase